MNKFVLLLAVFFALASCEETHDNSVTTTTTIDSSTSTTVNEVAKSDHEVDAELIKEGAKDLTALAKEIRAEKNKRDSVFTANREEVWVYQIGLNKSNPKDFEDTYNKLSQSMQHLYFFKRTRHDYYLILHDGYNSEQELLDKRSEIETALQQAGVNEKVRVINITTFCSMKEEIKPADGVRLKKKETVVCYMCD